MTPQQRHSALSLEIAPTSASFLSATLEHDFREEALAAHRRRAFPIVGFVALLGATLIYRDLVNLGVGDEFYDAILFRVPLLMFYVVVLVVLARVRSARVMDHVLLVWSLTVVGASIYLHLSRPVSPPTHHAVDVLMILILSVAVPNRFRYQAVPAVGLAVASLLQAIDAIRRPAHQLGRRPTAAVGRIQPRHNRCSIATISSPATTSTTPRSAAVDAS